MHAVKVYRIVWYSLIGDGRYAIAQKSAGLRVKVYEDDEEGNDVIMPDSMAIYSVS